MLVFEMAHTAKQLWIIATILESLVSCTSCHWATASSRSSLLMSLTSTCDFSKISVRALKEASESWRCSKHIIIYYNLMDSFQLEMGQEKTWKKLNEEHFPVLACWDRLLSPDYGLFILVSAPYCRMAASGPTEWTHAIDRIWEACHGSAFLRERNIQNDISQTHLWWYLYYKIVDGIPIKQFYSLWPLHAWFLPPKKRNVYGTHTHIYIYCFYVYTMTNLTTNSSIFEHCQVDQDLYLARFPTISGCGAARTKRVSSRKKRLGLVESRFFISSFADYKVVPPSYKLIYNPINYRYITYKP